VRDESDLLSTRTAAMMMRNHVICAMTARNIEMRELSCAMPRATLARRGSRRRLTTLPIAGATPCASPAMTR